MTQPTVLVLTGIGIPPYSARGLKQTLAPIDAASNMKRTINGGLADVSDPLFRKYQSTITGSDQSPPATDLVWPGRLLSVDCIVELSQEGSLTATDPIIIGDLGRVPVEWPPREADGFVFYRPRLTMRVTGWNIDTDEWDKAIGWTLNLEEV